MVVVKFKICLGEGWNRGGNCFFSRVFRKILSLTLIGIKSGSGKCGRY